MRSEPLPPGALDHALLDEAAVRQLKQLLRSQARDAVISRGSRSSHIHSRTQSGDFTVLQMALAAGSAVDLLANRSLGTTPRSSLGSNPMHGEVRVSACFYHCVAVGRRAICCVGSAVCLL
jgi:hypothetical protein